MLHSRRFACALVALSLGFFTVGSSQAASLLSLFTFGSGAAPDFTPDVDNLPGVPSVVQTGGSVTAAGATGTSFNDFNGGSHPGGKDISWGSGVNDPPTNTFSLNFDATGNEDFTVRYDYRSTANGAPSALLEYSANGGGFTTVQTDTYATDAAFHAISIDLSSLSAIENVSNVILRWTMSAVGNDGGTTGIDNIQLTGSAVPEPAAISLLAAVPLMLRRARKARLCR